MYGCESWTIKKTKSQRTDAFKLWCWRRLLIVPWTARRSNQSNLKKIKSWIFIGRTDGEAETLILWPPDVKIWLIWKDPNAGKDWRWEEKGMTEDEMVGWHHWLNGHKFEWTLGIGDGQGGLACYSPWGGEELDMTERLNWTAGTTRHLWILSTWNVSCPKWYVLCKIGTRLQRLNTQQKRICNISFIIFMWITSWGLPRWC